MPDIDLADARLHYEISGSGEAMLLIPGLGQTLEVWDPIVPALAEDFSVIQIDNRGIGQSLEKRAARNIDEYASDCVELLDALQVDKAHLMGMSFGGILAQRFAADHPQRVDRLVLISTTGGPTPYLRQMASLLGYALRYFPLAAFFETMELLGTSPEEFDANAARIAQSVAARAVDRRTRRVLREQLGCLLGACAMRGEAIVAPTLVLAGEYDALIPNIYGRRLAEGLPDGRCVVLKGCGHNPVEEQPRAMLQLVRGFLAGEEKLARDGLEFATN